MRAILVAAAIASVPSARAQPRPVNDVPITILWRGTAPANVAFEDVVVGRVDFDRATQPDRFVGHRRALGAWAFHVVTLSYGTDDFPLALRTRHNTPGVTLRLDGPTDMPCTRRGVTALAAVPGASPQATRLSAMVQARHLLRRNNNVCVAFGRRTLAEIYFRMNCSLAMSTDFFALSEEAKTYFRDTARSRDAAEREIRDCDAAVRGTALASLANERLAARRRGDFQGASAISGELLVLAADQAWHGGFEAQHMVGHNLRLIRAADLSDWQNTVTDPGHAREIGRQLAEVRANPRNRLAFRRRGNARARVAERSRGREEMFVVGALVAGLLVGHQRHRVESPTVRPLFADDLYREPVRARARRLTWGDRLSRGLDGRLYCRRPNGTTGLVIGMSLGRLNGDSLTPGGSSLLGALLEPRPSGSRGRVPADLRCR